MIHLPLGELRFPKVHPLSSKSLNVLYENHCRRINIFCQILHETLKQQIETRAVYAGLVVLVKNTNDDPTYFISLILSFPLPINAATPKQLVLWRRGTGRSMFSLTSL